MFKKFKMYLTLVLAPFLILLLVGVLSLSGCGSSSSGGGSTTYTQEQAAQAVGQSVMAWARSLSSITGLRNLPARGLDSRSDWVHFVQSFSSGGISYTIDVYIQFLDGGGQIISDVTDSSVVVTEKIYGTVTISGSGYNYIFTYGNGAADPLVISGLTGSIYSCDGPLTISFNQNGHAIVMQYDYNNVQAPQSGGYPSGVVTVTVNYDGANVYVITVTFNGTNIAVIQISGDGTYTVNLDTNEVS